MVAGRCAAADDLAVPALRVHRAGRTEIESGDIPRDSKGQHRGAQQFTVKRKAWERIELAMDRLARELLGIATSAESEAVKLNVIRDALDRGGLGAKTKVSVEVKPWEQLMDDSVGVAAISAPSTAPSKVDHS